MTILAAWQQTSSPQITSAMASLGFDWIILDIEHASIDFQEAESIFITAERYGSKPFVRLSDANSYQARRFLDAGAQGILVPVVEFKEEFDTFAEHCFYPPHGKRGLGLVRANLWGKTLEDYYKNFKPTIIAQIETLKGAENIESILKSKYIDGIMIGPYDLSASMGIAGQFENKEFKNLCSNILKTAKSTNKMIGFHQVEPCSDQLKLRMNEGYEFIAYGTDIVAVRHALRGIEK